MKFITIFKIYSLLSSYTQNFVLSITMKQFEASLDAMRSVCAPKFKLTTETLDDLRKGKFIENQELKCYTKCIAQMVGTLTKKGEVSIERTLAQIPIIIPPELQEAAKNAFNNCQSVQKNYKDSCDKVFYLTKCVYEYDPINFKFP